MLFLSILTHFENKKYKILALRANFEHTFTFDLISKQGRNKEISVGGRGRNMGFWPKYLPLAI